MARDFDELREGLAIDKDALDEGLIQQPQQYLDVSEAYALAVSRRDQAKDNLETLEARLNLDYRSDAESSGEKYTEPMLKAKVQQSKMRRQAYTEYLEACKEVDLLDGLRSAYRDRSYMLRSLADLYVTGYFTSSSVKGNTSRKVEEEAYNRRRAAMAEDRRKRTE